MTPEVILKNNRQLVRVTSCLGVVNKEGLNKWRGSVGNDFADAKLEEGRERGTRRHEYFEKIARGEMNVSGQTDTDDKIIADFKDWFSREVEEVLMIENRFESIKYGLTGKPDIIVRLKGRKVYCVIDYKSGSYLDKKSVAWQLAGYTKLAQEQGIDVQDRCVIHCHDKFKNPEFFSRKKLISDFKNLLLCRELFLALL